MKKLVAASLIVAVLAGLFAYAWLHARPRHSLVLITIDTLRADRLSLYGYAGVQTPNMDALARDSVLFKRAASHAPITLPAHASILTGLYPMTHGLRSNVGFYAPDSLTTLAEVLRENGYATGAFVSSFVLDSRFGLDQGFEVYDDMLEGPAQTALNEFAEQPADITVEKTLRWLEDRSTPDALETPFFLWTHVYDPHYPYEPPEPYQNRYRDRPYDGEIAFVDQEIGRILEWLKSQGVYDDAMIVLTADHGEGLGDHGESEHSIFVYESTQWVPLMIKLPRGKARGTTVEELVRHVDLVPTVLDVLRPSHVPDSFRGALVGTSLVGRMNGGPPLALASYAEAYLPKYSYGWSPLESLRDDQYKYIDAPLPELFDLRQDPGELKNLVEDQKGLAARMRRQLETLKKKLASENAESRARKGADLETVEKLMSLGYVGSVPIAEADRGRDPKEMFHLNEWMHEARLLVHDKDFQAAETKLNLLLEENPGNNTARSMLADVYKQLRRIDDAIAQLEEIRRRDPMNLETYFGLAKIYSKDKPDFAAAERELEAAFAIAPQETGLWLLKANLEHKKGNLDKSLELYGKAEMLGEQDPDLYVGFGSALNKLDRIDEARQKLEIAIRREPGNADAHYNLGVVLERHNDLPAAEAAYLTALEHRKEDAKSLDNLGGLYQRQGRYAEAEAVLSRSLQNQPGDFIALYNLGIVHLNTGRAESAATMLDAAARSQPGVPAIHHALARAYLQLERRDDAFEQFRILTQVVPPTSPGHAAAWCAMARVRAVQNRRKEAKEYLQTALQRGGDGVRRTVARDPVLKGL